MLAVGMALIVATVASAAPPSDGRVLAGVPAPVQCALIVRQKAIDGLILPVTGLGFLTLPVEVWRCTVDFLPPNAPAGAPWGRAVLHLFTLAGE
jgi:hypothetical protein